MSNSTSIQWTGATWNPVRARNIKTGKVGWFCEHFSPGCDNCYAERMNANTYFGNGSHYKASERPRLELFLDEKVLTQPLRWRKPQMIFPCSMTDLFGRFVPDEWVDRIFAVMALARRHTFQVLTKRAARLLEYAERNSTGGHILHVASTIGRPESGVWPRPNIWLGVSVENQKTADERIPLLLQTPAAVRWLSVEPMLGPIDLGRAHPCGYYCDEGEGAWGHRDHQFWTPNINTDISWVVVGGESGPGARPFNIDWARSIIEQCETASVPVFVKQLGAAPFVTGRAIKFDGLRFKDGKGGDINEWPEDLRVRQHPNPELTVALPAT